MNALQFMRHGNDELCKWRSLDNFGVLKPIFGGIWSAFSHKICDRLLE